MKKLILLLFIGGILLISGCSNNDLESLQEEKERLTNEVLELKELVLEKEDEIRLLKENNSDESIKLTERTKSLEMVRWSSIARSHDSSNSFYDLPTMYKLHSEHIIKDDWYVISDDYFQIELLNYDNAKKVDFYTVRLESEGTPNLVFTDTDHTDGWTYTDKAIGKIINKHKGPDSQGVTYEPYFLMYTEVTMEDGSVVRTSNLPIYNK
ncbi:hypothetical protein [Ornithinibacillus californiensis]|uniref:hypothetical protein n=1 Tax=Ornithinibacillus californiensis TaxID=161536 RepID=UPI00064DBAD1|nr:hypothetical protein [Ornithinibacillus californiensis]